MTPDGSAQEDRGLLESEGEARQEENKEGFGGNNITFFGSISLILNNITGPAMVVIPTVYSQAGFLTPTLLMIFIMIVSSLSSTLMCRAMALIPGNDRFQGRYELASLTKYYFPKWFYIASLALFVLSLQAMNIASIIECAQTMDLALIAAFNYTGALEFYPHPGWTHETDLVIKAEEMPFHSDYVISIGFIIIMAVCVPLGYFNLDDNQIVQEAALILMFVVLGEWYVDFFLRDWSYSRAPLWGNDQTQVLGSVIFNYAFVVTIPSWVNEKKEDVSINKVVWSTTIMSTVLFITVGWFGALAYPNPKGQDILHVINEHAQGKVLRIISEVAVYLFPIVVLLTGIPVFSIIVRYNLLQSGLCNKVWANIFAIIFPWIVSVIFYTGKGLINIINWTSLIVNGVINFIIPLLLFIVAESRAQRVAASLAGNPSIQVGPDEIDKVGTSLFQPLPPWKWLNAIYLTWGMIIITSALLLATFGLNIYMNTKKED